MPLENLQPLFQLRVVFERELGVGVFEVLDKNGDSLLPVNRPTCMFCKP